LNIGGHLPLKLVYPLSKVVSTSILHPTSTPYDNARIEYFHVSLKKEEVYTTSYSDFEEANLALFSYIEVFYNQNRIYTND
jgi:hypothetical protein